MAAFGTCAVKSIRYGPKCIQAVPHYHLFVKNILSVADFAAPLPGGLIHVYDTVYCPLGLDASKKEVPEFFRILFPS
jgi:hypothetical protein